MGKVGSFAGDILLCARKVHKDEQKEADTKE